MDKQSVQAFYDQKYLGYHREQPPDGRLVALVTGIRPQVFGLILNRIFSTAISVGGKDI